MNDQDSSRRLFLLRSLGGAGSAWLAAAALPEIVAAHGAAPEAAHEHARQAAKAGGPPKLEFFSNEQAAEIAAIAAQIIPSGEPPADQTPGAREARVIYFIDLALATFDAGRKETYRKGLKELEAAVAKKHPRKKFSELSEAGQIELLKSIEKTEFFEAVRSHTIIGFLANPEYGGNHEHAGWKLIGFEDAFAFEPPFGHYDRESAGQEERQRESAENEKRQK